MSIEILKLINHRLKPIDRRISQILRVGSVKGTDGALLDVEFSDTEVAFKVPYISLNGLYVGPRAGDLVLVFSADGRIEQAIALGVVKLANENGSGVTSLSNLGAILSDLSNSIRDITTPGYFVSTTGGPVNKSSGGPVLVETGGFK